MPTLLLAAIIGFVTAQAAVLVTTVYLHRGLTHRGLTLHPAAALPMRVVLWVSTGIRPREWVGVHRCHHANTDTVDDPHSPVILGATRVMLTNAYLYRRAAKDRALVERFTRDYEANWLDRVVFDRETLGPLLGLGALCLVFGWQVGLIAAAFHVVVYVGLNGAVNSSGHIFGTRPAENSATNSRLLGWLTWGEGLHNNHHAVPTAARFSFYAGQVDPAWPVIRLLERANLVTLRHNEGILVRA